MSLLEKLNQDLVGAMKSKDSVKAETIRSIKTAVKSAQVLKKTTEDLSDAEVVQVIQKQAKQRQDSIDMYKSANRVELVLKEQKELDILKSYLPQEADANKMREVLETLGSTNMGELIKEAKSILSDAGYSVDGKLLSTIVKEKLNG